MARDDLVHMLNQVAAYYAAYPAVEAIEGVHGHLLRFWSPTMRAQLAPLHGDPRVHALARAAIRRITAPAA